MKRLALALLLLASPALAGRLLVIRPFTVQSAKESENQRAAECWYGALNQEKVAYDVLPQSATPTLYVKNGVVQVSNTVSRTYTAALILDYQPAYAGGNFAPGFNPDSLTRYFYWPSIPVAFVGRIRTTGGSMFAQDTSQTTRPQTGVSTTGTYASTFSAYSRQLIGSDLVWKDWDCGFTSGTTPLTRVGGAGITRTIIACRSTSGHDYGLAAADPDDMVRMNQATADSSLLLWARYRDRLDPAPLFFCVPQAGNGTSSHDIAQILATIALLDSATGGSLIGSKAAYAPKKLAFYISGAFHRSSYTQAANVEGAGLNCDSQACADSVWLKGSLDSLRALSVPLTVGVNIDTVASYPYEKAWWAKFGANIRYAPESWEAYLNNLPTGLASRYSAADIFGVNRSRQLITAARYASGTACDGTDTTLSCLLAYARARIDSIPEFTGHAAAAIQAPGWDYIDFGRTREAMPDPDSLAAAMYRAGFRVAIVDPDAQRSAPSMTWGLNGAGASVIGAGLLALSPHSRRVNLRSGGSVIGSFYWATNRGQSDSDPSAAARGIVGNHPWHTEFLMGAFGGLWYPDDLVYYFHSFRTPLDCFTTRVGELAQQGAGSIPVRTGYLHIKWIVNEMRAVQALSWPGHQPAQFVFAEEL